MAKLEKEFRSGVALVRAKTDDLDSLGFRKNEDFLDKNNLFKQNSYEVNSRVRGFREDGNNDRREEGYKEYGFGGVYRGGRDDEGDVMLEVKTRFVQIKEDIRKKRPKKRKIKQTKREVKREIKKKEMKREMRREIEEKIIKAARKRNPEVRRIKQEEKVAVNVSEDSIMEDLIEPNSEKKGFFFNSADEESIEENIF